MKFKKILYLRSKTTTDERIKKKKKEITNKTYEANIDIVRRIY